MFRRREGRGTDSSNETRLLTNLTNRTITFGDIDNLELIPKGTLDLLKVASLQRIGSSVDLKTAVNQGWVRLKDRTNNIVPQAEIHEAIIPAVLRDVNEAEASAIIQAAIDAITAETVRTVVITTADTYALDKETDDILLCNSVAITVTLPTSANIKGYHFIVKNIHATGIVTINTTANETIDGESSETIDAQYTSLTFISDNANWVVI